MSGESECGASAPALPVPLERVSAIMRALSHDLRNALSVIDLQADYHARFHPETPPTEDSISVRKLVGARAESLRRLSAYLQPVQGAPVAFQASALLEDFRERLAATFPAEAPGVRWSDASGAAEIAVDLALFRTALLELFRNAFQWAEKDGGIAATAITSEGRWVFELRETKSTVALPPAVWGLEPFVTSRVGGHGVGLFHVRRIVAMLHGDITFAHDAGRAELTSRVSFPLAR